MTLPSKPQISEKVTKNRGSKSWNIDIYHILFIFKSGSSNSQNLKNRFILKNTFFNKSSKNHDAHHLTRIEKMKKRKNLKKVIFSKKRKFLRIVIFGRKMISICQIFNLKTLKSSFWTPKSSFWTPKIVKIVKMTTFETPKSRKSLKIVIFGSQNPIRRFGPLFWPQNDPKWHFLN